jgi:hypothetical protein
VQTAAPHGRFHAPLVFMLQAESWFGLQKPIWECKALKVAFLSQQQLLSSPSPPQF